MNDETGDVPFDDAISKEEVLASIRNLKLWKSEGPDEIVGEMPKCVDDDVIDFLVHLFNKLYDDSIFPQESSELIIVPIHKK